MKKTKLILVLIPIVFTTCVKEIDDPGSSEPDPLYTFLFENTKDHNLTLEFKNLDNQPISGVSFEVFSTNPFKEDNQIQSSKTSDNNLLFRGSTNNQGSIELILSLPNYLDTIYIVPRFIGLNQYYAIPFQTSSGTVEIKPGKAVPYKSASALPRPKNGLLYEYHVLGSWDISGTPDYLEPIGDEISNDFLADVNATLPEYAQLPQSHPQYLASGVETNIVLEEDCEIWVTFVHEGAGWKNTLGYYIYPTDSAPATIQEVREKTIIFPNTSYAGAGGNLNSGDKVKLRYFNSELGVETDTFPSGYVVGWFLVANGWSNGIVNGSYIHYSNYMLNNETDDELKKHNVLLYDDERDLFLLGFEDVRRDNSSCDQDFNDAIFYATANPIEAVQTENMQPIDDPYDSDGDGVSNVFDEYPDDPDRAYNYYYPSNSSFGTLAYEDLWPYKGDYDFNDLVIDYQFKSVANSENNIVEIEPKIVVRAIGAGFHNGFGLSFELLPSDISNITGQQLEGNIISLEANGTESGQSKAVIMVFDDAYDQLSIPAGGTYVNTMAGDPWVEPDTITLLISLSTPMSSAEIGLPPYNPFIFVNQDRSVEIHLPGQAPTDLVDESLFGTGHDGSDPASGKYYFTAFDYPWAANIPESFQYPQEKTKITDAHLVFGTWASSNGYNYMDWFQDKPGYRNLNKIYNPTAK